MKTVVKTDAAALVLSSMARLGFRSADFECWKIFELVLACGIFLDVGVAVGLGVLVFLALMFLFLLTPLSSHVVNDVVGHVSGVDTP